MSTPPQTEPYKGLRPYEEGDQENFFGRDTERKILVNKILANRLTLLFAASGVGKSSLLQAAVLPQLKDPRQENRDAVYYRDWVTPPLAGLKQAVLDYLAGQHLLEPEDRPDELHHHDSTLSKFFSFCTLFTRHPLVLILDQFEEFFQYQRYQLDFKPFIEQLAIAITNATLSVHIVISMREDFALELNAFKPALPTLLFENFYRLEKLTKEQALEAIDMPVQRFGFHYEPALLETLLKDLASREASQLNQPVMELMDTVEPAYLQIICSQLWDFEHGSANKTLHLQTYRDKGGADALLRTYVENVLNRFSAKDKALVSGAFNHLITRRGTKMAFTAGTLSDLLSVEEKALSQVLETLHQRYILRRQARFDAKTGGSVYWYELYHDLFSSPIERWNSTYRAQQRGRRTIKTVGVIMLAIIALYAGYDALINYQNYHFRLDVKRSVSDGVELYKGKTGSTDLFHQHRYLTETGYLWAQLEPDKLFHVKPIVDYDNFVVELIGHLPLRDRIRAYWDSGEMKKALSLAEVSISEDDIQRSQGIIEDLAPLRSAEITSFFRKLCSQTHNSYLKEKLTTATRKSYNVRSLISTLTYPCSGMRAQAAEALGRLGAREAVAPLLPLLKDSDSDVRRQAAEALRRLGAREAVAPLLPLLKDSDRDVRFQAAGLLGDLGDQRAVAPLLPLLQDSDRDVRFQAAEALGRLGAREAVAPLLALLKDSDSYIRFHRTVEVLGDLGDQRAVAPLLALLQDSDRDVRFQAAGALGRLGTREAVAPLLALLKDSDSGVRRQAAEVLGRLGAREAVAPLLALLKDSDSDARGQAAGLLGDLGDQEAVVPLLALLSDLDNDVRRQAAGALGRLGTREAVAPLLALLKDPDSDVRFQAAGLQRGIAPSPDRAVRSKAAEALGRLGAREAVAPLLALLQDSDRYVRRYATEALGRLGAREAVAPLLPLLQDSDSDVRAQVAEVLGRLGDSEVVLPLIGQLHDNDPGVRRVVTLTLGDIAYPDTLKAIASIYENEKEENSVRIAAAVSLLKFNQQYGMALLNTLAKSGRKDDRQEVAEILGTFFTKDGSELLTQLLQDDNYSIKEKAIRSLGKIKCFPVLPQLHEYLTDVNTNIQLVAAKALGELASSESIQPLAAASVNPQYAMIVRLTALKALRNIGTDRATDAIIAAAKQDEARLGLQASKLLGELKAQSAFPWLRARVEQLEGQYRIWRDIRDADRKDSPEREENAWLEKLAQSNPESYWAFPLAYAMAQIDPEKTGFEHLSHNLAAVRYGAWMGLGKVGTVAMVERLQQARLASKNPLFRHAAYHAIDHILIKLETDGSDEDVQKLVALYGRVKDQEGIGTRVEWTIDQLRTRYK